MQIIAPKGTKDILPKAVQGWQYLENIIRKVCSLYGYEEIRTPVFEYTELFNRGIGETTDIVEKEMYTFMDRGERSLTLRPENTASSVRAYIENKLYADNPLVKLYYIGPMFRAEKPQAGRFRQFHQFGAEAIGLPGPDVDAEIILLAVDFLSKLGLKDLNLLLNSVGCPVCRPVYRTVLQDFLRDKFDSLCSDCQSRFDRNPMRILDCKNPSCKEAVQGAPVLKDYLCDDCSSHFVHLQELLKSLDIKYTLDETLVRGLDYYTKTAFEIQYNDLGAQTAICGGGRYDGLVEEIGGEPTPGIGFAIGLERVLLALENQNLMPDFANMTDVFVLHTGAETEKAAFNMITALRRADVSAQMDFSGRSMKSQMKLANRLNARYVLITGEDEVKNNLVSLKDMLTGEQEQIKMDEIDKIIAKVEVHDDDRKKTQP